MRLGMILSMSVHSFILQLAPASSHLALDVNAFAALVQSFTPAIMTPKEMFALVPKV